MWAQKAHLGGPAPRDLGDRSVFNPTRRSTAARDAPTTIPHGMHAGAKSPWEASRAALHSHTDKTCGRRRGDWPLQILDMLPRSYVNLRHAMARPRTARVTPPLRAKGTYLGSQTTPAAFNGQSLSPAAAREAQGRGSLAARAGREEEMTAGARGRTRWATGAPRVER